MLPQPKSHKEAFDLVKQIDKFFNTAGGGVATSEGCTMDVDNPHSLIERKIHRDLPSHRN